MRLIDADALKTVKSIQNKYADFNSIESIQNWIDHAPTIDAEPIVRCKDCRHANECCKIVQYARNEQNTVSMGYLPIEWCSRGERREP